MRSNNINIIFEGTEFSKSEAYSVFLSKYNYQSSERFIKLLRILMNDEEVVLANMLPGNALELSKSCKSLRRGLKSCLRACIKGDVFEFSGGYRQAKDIFQLHDATGSDIRSDEI